MIEKFNQKREVPNENSNSDLDQRMIVSLPWVPGLSPKLRKTFRKSNVKAVFKSSANLKTILTMKNKTKLPDLSNPGVYKIDCKCSKSYVGETKLKVSTRVNQHKKTIDDEKWESSGVSQHAKDCNMGFKWDDIKNIKAEERTFDRKVREALEIQRWETAPHNDRGLNQDDGQYVVTNFWRPMLSYLQEKSL